MNNVPIMLLGFGNVGQSIARLVEQNEGGLFQLVGGAVLADPVRQAADQAVLGVDLQDPLGGLVDLAVLLQHALQVHVHVALVGHQANRAFG